MTSVTAYPGTRELAFRSNDGMDVALLAGAGVALLGALVALLFLPARASAPEADDSGTERSEVGLHVG